MIRFVGLLARFVTMMICWAILMGVPVLVFHGPLTDPGAMKRFLGLFYTLLLGVTVLVGRSWGASGVLGVALPFWAFFFVLALSKAADPALPVADKVMWALNFGAIVPVTWLGWRLGSRLKSPARDSGRLL